MSVKLSAKSRLKQVCMYLTALQQQREFGRGCNWRALACLTVKDVILSCILITKNLNFKAFKLVLCKFLSRKAELRKIFTNFAILSAALHTFRDAVCFLFLFASVICIFIPAHNSTLHTSNSVAQLLQPLAALFRLHFPNCYAGNSVRFLARTHHHTHYFYCSP